MRRSALKSCCRGTVRGVGRGRQLRARKVQMARANTTHSQPTQHRRPPHGRNSAGRNGQPLALPRRVPNAGGGLVVEVQRGEVGVVQNAGDEAACGSDRGLVAVLGFSVRRIERNSERQHIRTMLSSRKVLFSSSASATTTRPSPPMLLLLCNNTSFQGSSENKTQQK